MKQVLKNAKAIIAILILAISLNGCENNNDDLPEVIAGFTHTINEITGTVTFINTTTDATKYIWDFGDGTTSTEINPIKSYASGTYTIVLRAFNVSGASDTYEDTITILRKGPATLPINFDEVAVVYNVTAFDGAAFEIIENPSVSGTNNITSKVGKITNVGVAYEGIFMNLGTQVDLTSNKTIKMNFWSNSAVDVLLKLENGTAAAVEKTTRHTGTGWETISFDFNSSAKYSKLAIFVDGIGTKAGVFYIDDIIQIQTPPPPCLDETAESMSAASLNVTFKSDQTANIIKDGTSFQWVSNPNNTGINTSCKVGNVTNLGIAPWDNVQINLDAKLDFTTHSGLKIKVYSLKAGTKVSMKLEEIGTPGNNSGNVAVVRTKTGEWEELIFPFPTTASGKYNKIVLFFDFENKDTDTYYFDDLTFYGTGGGGACAAETAESMSAASLNVTFKSDQTANIIKDGASFEYLSNPKSDTGINTSCKVGKVTNLGIAPWDNVQINLDAKLDFTSHSGFKIKVYSAKAGTKLTIKLEEIGNPGNNTEVGVVRTKTNEWEELTVPFPSTASGKYNKIVLFFDLENKDSDTYYFDDLIFYGSGSGTGGGGGTAAGEIAQNGGFETGDLSNWAVYNNGGTVSAVTTQPSTGTYCAMLVASPTGLNPTLKQERKGAGTLTVGDKVKITFDYKGSAAGGGIYSIQSFVEATNGVNQTVNISINPTSTWQTYTTTYTVAAGDVSGGVTLEFVAICGGVAGCSSTLYIDNASLIINP
jgi:hypothetical protein